MATDVYQYDIAEMVKYRMGDIAVTHTIISKATLEELVAKANLLDRLEENDCMDLNKLNAIEDAHAQLFAPN